MSSDCQKTSAKAIPTTRMVNISDSSHLPHDYCTTPGGTLFSTTPGGTRIIYDRKFLLERRSSPVTKTPPKGLPVIPGVTSPPSTDTNAKSHELTNTTTAPDSGNAGDDSQFEMDI